MNSYSYKFPTLHPKTCFHIFSVFFNPLFSIYIPIEFLYFSYSYVLTILHSKEALCLYREGLLFLEITSIFLITLSKISLRALIYFILYYYDYNLMII
jgi:hypothetical protein